MPPLTVTSCSIWVTSPQRVEAGYRDDVLSTHSTSSHYFLSRISFLASAKHFWATKIANRLHVTSSTCNTLQVELVTLQIVGFEHHKVTVTSQLFYDVNIMWTADTE